MKSEIRQVMNSLVRLNEDIKDLNLFELDIDYQHSIISIIDEGDKIFFKKIKMLIEKLEKEIQEKNNE